MTYRQDSDIVHSYGRVVRRNFSSTIYDHQSIDIYLDVKTNQSTFDVAREFSERKNRIAWFVSNCQAKNQRNRLGKKLGEFFPVDQYGRCSSMKSNETFEETLKKYKFYLAFENSHCKDYITEKSFYNALALGLIPIVFGPTKEDTEKILPVNSFLHIEQFDDLKRVIEQLNSISEDSERFAFYHQWRIDHRLITWPSNYYVDDRFCDLCIKLHDDSQPSKFYTNFSSWLNQCT